MSKREDLERQIVEYGLTDLLDVSARIEIKTPADEWLDRFITTDPELIAMKRKVKKLSFSKINTLIIGESGVGKELIAHALHGDRKGKFVAINCGGIPDTLIESEFFGYIRGSYTGANQDREGYFEEAQNGTLFLDEIGEMPHLLQCKLLRVLQSGVIRRIGDRVDRKINCRIVAATNRKEEWLQNTTSFRQDLYYRLAGTTLKIKPLRERLDDVTLIFRHHQLNPDDFNRLGTNWTGNVRELLNVIEEHKALNE